MVHEPPKENERVNAHESTVTLQAPVEAATLTPIEDSKDGAAMTKSESDRIDILVSAVNELTVEVRTANATNKLEIEHIKSLCDERHGANRERVEHLEKSERKSYSFRARVSGMGVPLGLCVAVGLGVLNLVK